MGEEVDKYASSTSVLREEIQALTGVDIMKNENEYKSLYSILQDISYAYKYLTDVSQANVLEILFGKRQANVGAAILSNFDIVESAYQASLDSAGSASAEYEKWLNSIEAKQQQFAAQFQALSVQIIDSDLVSGVIDTGTGILGFLTKVVETLGTIPALAGTAAAALSFKNKGKPVNMPTIVLLHFCAVVQINPQTAGNG